MLIYRSSSNSIVSNCRISSLSILTFFFAEINSNFIEIAVHLFADAAPGAISSDVRALLPIYLDSFFSLPITRADGTKMDFEAVVTALDAETLSYTIDSGRPRS